MDARLVCRQWELGRQQVAPPQTPYSAHFGPSLVGGGPHHPTASISLPFHQDQGPPSPALQDRPKFPPGRVGGARRGSFPPFLMRWEPEDQARCWCDVSGNKLRTGDWPRVSLQGQRSGSGCDLCSQPWALPSQQRYPGALCPGLPWRLWIDGPRSENTHVERAPAAFWGSLNVEGATQASEESRWGSRPVRSARGCPKAFTEHFPHPFLGLV